jgi:hypothetical protein
LRGDASASYDRTGENFMTSSTPPAGSHEEQPGTEYLEQGGGAPLGREPSSGGRRKAVLAGTAVVGLAAVGAGVWAAASFFATGAQPAEALPASTIGYASVDLDPSGGQKLEAFRMLDKFPAFEEEIGLDADDDIKRRIFEEAGLADTCDGLDYAKHVEPWLGDRAAVAAVDLGKEQPVPVGILEVTDADAAAGGLDKLRECADEQAGWTIDGDWAVVAETEALAREVVSETAEGNLADDSTYRQRMEEVGEAGVANLYVAAEAGQHLADYFEHLVPFGEMGPGAPSGLPDEVTQGMRGFKGMAATLRFDDGALEFEAVSEAATMQQGGFIATDAGDDVLASLPEDTAAAIGIGFEDGWAQRYLDQVTAQLGGGPQADKLIAQAEMWTGLELPEDVETLLGDSTVLAVGADFDPEVFENSPDGSDVPIGLKMKGDPEAIERVLDKIRGRIGPASSGPLGSSSEGDVVVVGPNADYRARMVGDGGLGDSETFRDVVRESERAGGIVFVNFDAGDGWLDALAEEDPEAKENLAPLDAFGASTWQDGDTSHAMVRLTTD